MVENKIEYCEGYIAFIDILGFSNYVLNKDNSNNTFELFEFIKKFQYLYNTSPSLNFNIAFFSDSLVMSTTTGNLIRFAYVIALLESHLKQKLQLIVRGAIVKGEYYHNGDIAFGPAIINAYRLEKSANFGRVIVEDTVAINFLSSTANSIICCKDIDGKYYINTHVPFIFDIVEGTVLTFENLCINLIRNKEEIIRIIRHYKETEYVDKYIWNITPHNECCEFAKKYLQERGIESLEEKLKIIDSYKITLQEI
jgi:hypothetical protein